eukprot:comp12014_c0_seq1/m.6715 comp12014_c0_seq1/g.6715  ORF comp12014_c0_seq1/g.6715 comp12014_c0_seq1/m.6715 type:complete len:286 (+) comp12014_c0_seq1:1108-1965(+)
MIRRRNVDETSPGDRSPNRLPAYPQTRITWPRTRGATTVSESWVTTVATGTVLLAPSTANSSAGVINIPKKLPNAELKIAAGSFPPAALVRMTAEDTGGGIHPRAKKPLRIRGSTRSVVWRNATRKTRRAGTKVIEKDWMKRWRRTCLMARISSSVFKDRPLKKKIIPTAPYLTVYSGCRGPCFCPIPGAIFAAKMTQIRPPRNQFLCSSIAKDSPSPFMLPSQMVALKLSVSAAVSTLCYTNCNSLERRRPKGQRHQSTQSTHAKLQIQETASFIVGPIIEVKM